VLLCTRWLLCYCQTTFLNLECGRLAGQVQVFKLAAMVDEYAYLLAADYAASLAAARVELQARSCKLIWLLSALFQGTRRHRGLPKPDAQCTFPSHLPHTTQGKRCGVSAKGYLTAPTWWP